MATFNLFSKTSNISPGSLLILSIILQGENVIIVHDIVEIKQNSTGMPLNALRIHCRSSKTKFVLISLSLEQNIHSNIFLVLKVGGLEFVIRYYILRVSRTSSFFIFKRPP